MSTSICLSVKCVIEGNLNRVLTAVFSVDNKEADSQQSYITKVIVCLKSNHGLCLSQRFTVETLKAAEGGNATTLLLSIINIK